MTPTPRPAGPSVWQPYDPVRSRLLVTADPTVTAHLRRTDASLAAVSEYVQATGTSMGRLMALLDPFISDGTLALEPVGDDLFLHTAQWGRPAPAHCADVPPNLWERLRERHDPDGAAALWQLARRLRWAGWTVETNRARIAYANSPHVDVVLGIHTAVTGTYGALPILTPNPTRPADGVLFDRTSAHLLAEPTGPLTTATAVGVGKVVVCAEGDTLDVVVTQVRRWLLSRPAGPALSVYVLDSPRFDPVLLEVADGTVTPTAVRLR